MSIDRPLKIGIIGAGFVTGTSHLPSLVTLGDRIELTAIADNRPEALEHISKHFSFKKLYTDPYEMLRENELDLVHVCTANNTHKEYTIAALRAGANVFCEKPLALTLKDAEEMFAEAEKAGKLLIACQNNRMGPMQEVKKLVEDGVLGEVYFCEIDNFIRRGVPAWGRFHVKSDNGAGPLCDIGVHYLDATLFAINNPRFTAVSATTFTKLANKEDCSIGNRGPVTGEHTYLPRNDYNYSDFSVEDFASGLVRFENGMQMIIKFSWALNLPSGSSYKLAGDKAGLVYDKTGKFENPISIHGVKDGQLYDEVLEIPIAKKGAMHDVGHEMLIHHVVDVVQNGVECIIKKEEMLNVVAIMEAFYKSGELGREVTRDELEHYVQ